MKNMRVERNIIYIGKHVEDICKDDCIDLTYMDKLADEMFVTAD